MNDPHAHRAPPLRLTQITDCHLSEAPGGRLLGVDTDRSLQAVLAQLRRQRPHSDLLLLTGDLADHGGAGAYRRLLALTRDLARDQRWLPGNHDDVATLAAVLAADPRGLRTAVLGNWLVLTLCTPVAGRVEGHLDTDQLDWLRTVLAAHRGHHTLIALHHPVLPVGSAWLDAIAVTNAGAFWDTIAPFPQVKVVLGGHVHMATDQSHRGVRVITSPSTCVQFAPGSESFRVEATAPGYRWLDLYPDGRIETAVSRVADFTPEVDLDASGY